MKGLIINPLGSLTKCRDEQQLFGKNNKAKNQQYG
jgi:hypothetical protein